MATPVKILVALAVIVVIAVGASIGYQKYTTTDEEVKTTGETKGSSYPSLPTSPPTPSPVTKPTTQPPAVTDETDDWKTYRNHTFGFEFKYPQDWQINERVTPPPEPWQEEYASNQGGGLNVLRVTAGDAVDTRSTANDAYIRLGAGRINLELENKYCGAYTTCEDYMEDTPYSTLEVLSGGKISTMTVNGFRTDIYNVGGYECYACTKEDGRLLGKNVRALVCNSTYTACIQITTNEYSMDKQEIKDFFINEFLPTLKIQPTFESLECRPTEQIRCHG